MEVEKLRGKRKGERKGQRQGKVRQRQREWLSFKCIFKSLNQTSLLVHSRGYVQFQKSCHSLCNFFSVNIPVHFFICFVSLIHHRSQWNRLLHFEIKEAKAYRSQTVFQHYQGEWQNWGWNPWLSSKGHTVICFGIDLLSSQLTDHSQW